MRHGSGGRRSRNRGGKSNNRHGGNGTKSRTYVYDSNGPDVRIRGTAHQVFDKYDALAKDANSAGDHILAQSYLQFAEHYQRIINNWEEALANGGIYPEEMAASRDNSAEDDSDEIDGNVADNVSSAVSRKNTESVRELADA